jgi:hypothetical protein
MCYGEWHVSVGAEAVAEDAERAIAAARAASMSKIPSSGGGWSQPTTKSRSYLTRSLMLSPEGYCYWPLGAFESKVVGNGRMLTTSTATDRLPSFDPSLATAARRGVEKLGVEVWLVYYTLGHPRACRPSALSRRGWNDPHILEPDGV